MASFSTFRPLFSTPSRRKMLIAVPAILVQFFIFKQFYPFASFFQDSYSYIYAALVKDTISYRPVGYSWFLILIHSLSTSDTFLVFIQYCLLQLACLYLYFSIEKLYSPHKIIGNILFFFLLLNPIFLYVANVVSSDALFISLSLVWLTELLWLMHRPSRGRLMVQLVLLILIFYTRYNALCYPVIAAAAFLMVVRKGGIAFTITGIVSCILVLVLGVTAVAQITREQTGVRIFSAFSGWQIANNALYVYPYIQVDTDRLPSPECRELDRMVKEYFDTSGAAPHRGHQPVDTWYMWNLHSPLKAYMYRRQSREHTSYFVAWNRAAPVFSQYGYYLLSRHPLLFCREYGWPSARTFFYPSLEMLLQYNEGEKEVDQTAKDWFHYKSREVHASSPTVQGRILAPFPVFYLFINLAFVSGGIFFLLWGRERKKFQLSHPDFRKGLLLTAVYFGVNAAFCIFATPNMFRYQLAPMIWLFVFTLLGYHLLLSRWNPGPAAQKE